VSSKYARRSLAQSWDHRRPECGADRVVKFLTDSAAEFSLPVNMQRAIALRRFALPA
jgi:hypothetical protein